MPTPSELNDRERALARATHLEIVEHGYEAHYMQDIIAQALAEYGAEREAAVAKDAEVCDRCRAEGAAEERAWWQKHLQDGIDAVEGQLGRKNAYALGALTEMKGLLKTLESRSKETK
jgi:hypothetical protein